MKKSILLAAVTCMLTGSAFAGTLESILAGLTADGYTIKEVDKTLLGNYKIEAYKGTIEREIVYNSTLDSVLRDRIDDDDDGKSIDSSADDSSDNEPGDDNGGDEGSDHDSGDDHDGGGDHDSGGNHDSGGDHESGGGHDSGDD